ncbi:hypothetical protein R1flu_007589 [Riccia fluitans]|uniref:Bulb-type lectin domain-containing protein n=1 Tax=Riccia fluitans TaxID=41844 RepID=A0ABD1YZA7_9MARC
MIIRFLVTFIWKALTFFKRKYRLKRHQLWQALYLNTNTLYKCTSACMRTIVNYLSLEGNVRSWSKRFRTAAMPRRSGPPRRPYIRPIATSLCKKTEMLLFTTNKNAIWYTGTYTVGSAYIILQCDGNVVLYDPVGKANWATNQFRI